MNAPRPLTAPSATPWLAYAGLSLTSLFWAGNALVARGVIEMIPPLALSFFRWLAVAVLLLPFSVRAYRRHRETVHRHWRPLLILALLSVSSYNSLLYLSARGTTALNLTLVSSLLPVATALLARPLLGHRLSPASALGIGLAFLGALFIILKGQFLALAEVSVNPGDFSMLLAMFLWALYSVLLQRWALPIGGFDLFALLVAIGVVLLFPWYLAERAVVGDFAWSGELLLIIGYVSLFASLAAYLCWNYGVRQTSPSTAALFSYLLPLFTAILSVPVLGEAPQLYHLGGGLMILGGLWWSQRSR